MSSVFAVSPAAWKEHRGKDVSAIATFDDLPLYYRGTIMKMHAHFGDDAVKFIGATYAPDGTINIETEGKRFTA